MNLVLAASPICIGLVCLCLGVIGFRFPLRGTVKTRARVVDLVSQTIYRYHTEIQAVAIVVEFTTEQGTCRAVADRFYPEWQMTRRLGEELSIVYSRKNPSRFHVVGERGVVQQYLCLSGIGMILADMLLLWQYIE